MAAQPKLLNDITASASSQWNLEHPEVTRGEQKSKKAASFVFQEITCSLPPTAAVLQLQLTSKGGQNVLFSPEKLETAKKMQPSPSSPAVCSDVFSVGQATTSALTETVVTDAMLLKRSKSSIAIKTESARKRRDFASIKMEDKRWAVRVARVGEGERAPAEKPKPPPQTPKKPFQAPKEPLCSGEKLLDGKSRKMGEPQEQHASERALTAVTEEGKELGTGKKGKKKPRCPEDISCSREKMGAQPVCPSQHKGKADNQSSEDTPRILSASDILLATIVGLRNATTADAMNAAESKLCTILEDHREAIKDKVLEITINICGQISSIPEGRAKRIVLHVVTSLARRFAGDVVSGLLRHSLSGGSNIGPILRSLSSVPRISSRVLWNILQRLQPRPRFERSSDRHSTDPAGLLPLAAVRVLAEMLKTSTCTMDMQGFYSGVFLALVTHIHFLVTLPEYMEVSWDKSEATAHSITEHIRLAEQTLKTLLTQDGNQLAVLWMDRAKGWDLLICPEHHLEGTLLLARAVVIHARDHVIGLLGEVIPKLCTEDEERTLTARALFAGIICSKFLMELLPRKNILAKLEGWQADHRPTVRWLSMHGFGNMALIEHKVKRLKVLATKLLLGLKDTDERTVTEALRALRNLLSRHQGRVCLSSTCIRIVEQLCPHLTDVRPLGNQGQGEIKGHFHTEQERDQVHAAAVGLFGNLVLKLQHRHKARMREHVLAHVVPFLIHLQGTNPVLIESCEWTLARCNKFLGWRLLEEIELLAHYDSQEALSEICRCLVERYPDRVSDFLTQTVEYMKSPKTPLRRAATVVAGFLVFYLDATTVSQEVMASLQRELAKLKCDPERSVSSAASVSLLEVWQVHRHTARCGLLHGLGKVFCYDSDSEQKRPLFEDSPFKRRRSLEFIDELYY